MPPSFPTLLSAAARLHPAPSRLVPQLCLRSGGRFPQPESLLASLSSPIQTAAASRHPCLAPRSRRVCDVSVKPPWKAGAPQRSGAALGVLHRAGIVLILPLSLSVAAAPAALTAPCSPPFGAAPGVWQPQEQTRCGLEPAPAPAPSTACSVRVVPELQRSARAHFALLQVWCDWEQSPRGDFSACVSSEQQNLPTPPVPEALLSLAASRTGAASAGDFGSPGKAPCCRQARAVKLCFPECDAVRGSNHGHGSQHLALLSAVVQPRFQQGSAQEPPGP